MHFVRGISPTRKQKCKDRADHPGWRHGHFKKRGNYKGFKMYNKTKHTSWEVVL